MTTPFHVGDLVDILPSTRRLFALGGDSCAPYEIIKIIPDSSQDRSFHHLARVFPKGTAYHLGLYETELTPYDGEEVVP